MGSSQKPVLYTYNDVSIKDWIITLFEIQIVYIILNLNEEYMIGYDINVKECKNGECFQNISGMPLLEYIRSEPPVDKCLQWEFPKCLEKQIVIWSASCSFDKSLD